MDGIDKTSCEHVARKRRMGEPAKRKGLFRIGSVPMPGYDDGRRKSAVDGVRKAVLGWSRQTFGKGEVARYRIRNDSPAITAQPRENTTIYAIIAREMKVEVNGIAYEIGVRRLTPRELLRLQAVPEWAIDRILSSDENGHRLISNTQAQKMAGNSIAVSPLAACLESLLFPVEGSVNAMPAKPKPMPQPRHPTLFD